MTSQSYYHEHPFCKALPSSVRQLVDDLYPLGLVYLVGGAVRDILCQRKPKDYDILVDLSEDGGKAASYLQKMSELQSSRTMFGGHSLLLADDVKADVWEVKNDINVQKSTMKFSPQNYLKVQFLTIDACLVHLGYNEEIFTHAQFGEHIRNKTLHINHQRRLSPEEAMYYLNKCYRLCHNEGYLPSASFFKDLRASISPLPSSVLLQWDSYQAKFPYAVSLEEVTEFLTS